MKIKVKYYCIEPECNKEVSRKGNRCQSCAAKERFKDPKNNPAYKDNRSKHIKDKTKFDCKNRNCRKK